MNELSYLCYSVVSPRIVGQQEEEVSAVEGHMVSLVCDVQTHPAPEIIWTRDGQLLKLGSGVYILSGNMQEHKHCHRAFSVTVLIL